MNGRFQASNAWNNGNSVYVIDVSQQSETNFSICFSFFLVNPIPVKAPNSVCEVEGQTFIDGDDMEVYKGDLANGECEQCTCKDGMLVDCHHIFHCVLNDSSCNSYSKKPGQCCPTCERGIVGKFTVSQF